MNSQYDIAIHDSIEPGYVVLSAIVTWNNIPVEVIPHAASYVRGGLNGEAHLALAHAIETGQLAASKHYEFWSQRERVLRDDPPVTRIAFDAASV